MNRVELLAPAGNPEGFYGAIHAGADAVYLAGNRFGARAYADNFTSEELIECIKYAHLWGRRVYLTVNTLIKETEFNELLPYLKPFYEAGLDGVIVQDIGVFCFIREHFPNLELHVSTQMTLTGKYGAGLLKKMGASRVVPARELSLDELVEMKQETGLEIEAFIHGAMCYCYSGQCLFSSILGGRSGNRGRCAQPCRLSYRMENTDKNSKESFVLSLKDMCTIEHIPQLIAAGIDSFKIEGRMKKPEYAAGVTAIYRKYIDRYYAGKDYKIATKDLEDLAKLYIRSERQDGYYFRHNGRDMVTLDSPSYSGADDEFLASIRSRYLTERPSIPVKIHAFFEVGKPAKIVFALSEDETLCVEAKGEIVSAAMKQPITDENIRKQLSKLGETAFTADCIHVSMDENAFYPLKSINELRRQAVGLLECSIIHKNGFCTSRVMPKSISAKNCCQSRREGVESSLHVLVRTRDQLDAIVDCLVDSTADRNVKRVYLEADLLYNAFIADDDHVVSQCSILRDKGCMLVIALPPILRKRDEKFLDEVWNAFYSYQIDSNNFLFQGFLVRSMDGLGFLDAKGYGSISLEAIFGDASFYIWNRESMHAFSGIHDNEQMLSAKLNGFCMPYELRSAEQRQLLVNFLSIEKVVYGRIPLMHTANCVVNTLDGCDRNGTNKVCYLTDRYKKRFPVLRNCTHCMNTIYNSLPLSLHGELHKWQGEVDFRLDFTIENGRETARILQYFMSGANGELPFAEYTTGHEKRGVE